MSASGPVAVVCALGVLRTSRRPSDWITLKQKLSVHCRSDHSVPRDHVTGGWPIMKAQPL